MRFSFGAGLLSGVVGGLMVSSDNPLDAYFSIISLVGILKVL